MASTRNTSHVLHGVLIPDGRLTYANLSASDSSYTQAGPKAGGVGVPSTAYAPAVIETLGEQDDTFDVILKKGGYPAVEAGMRFAYKVSTDATTSYLGWNTFNLITGWFPVTTWGTTDMQCVTAIAQSNGKILTCAINDTSDVLNLRWIDPTDHSVTTVNGPSIIVDNRFAAVCEMPSGHILLMCREAVIPSGGGAVSGYDYVAYRSTTRHHSGNSSAGWTLHSAAVFSDTVYAADAERTRLLYVAENDEYAFFSFDAGDVRQYASNDGASSFSHIGSVSVGGVAVPDACLLSGGGIGVAYVNNANGDLMFVRLGGAFDAFSTASAVIVTSSENYQACWIMQDPVGYLYIYGLRDTTEDRVDVFISSDSGVTWAQNGGLCGTYVGDANTHLDGGVAVHCRGAGWLIHQFSDATSTADPTVCCMKLGGYSNITLNPYISTLDGLQQQERYRISWWDHDEFEGETWFPIALPDNWNWTAAGAGTGAHTNGAAEITVSANTKNYTKTITKSNQFAGLFEFKVASGGSLTTKLNGFSIHLDDGASYREIGIRATTTAFAIRDELAALQLSTATVDMTSYMQFLVLCNLNDGSNCTLEVYYKRPYDTVWTQTYGNNAAGLGTAAGTTSQVVMGAQANDTGTSSYRLACWAGGSEPITAAGVYHPYFWGGELTTQDSGENRLVGRLINSSGAELWHTSADGDAVCRLRATDGPGRFGDSYTIAPAYDYPASNIDCTVSPSPRAKWRSTDDTEQIFAWTPEGTYDTSLTRHIGVALLGVNFESAYLEGWTGAAWTSLLYISLKRRLSGLKYARTGNVLRIDAGGSAADRYIWRNELVGAHVDLGSSKVRKIQSHTEGLWADTAGKHVEILIDGVDGTEPSTGTLDIWPHSGYSVAHGISAMYDKYRLRIPAQTTAENYFEAGNIIIGEVMTFGFQPSWGSNYKWEPNVETFEDRSGTTRYRALGPTKRSWTLAWTDEEDWTNIRDMTPDYFAHEVTTEGMANLGDAPMQLAGLLEQLKSGEVPIVALANINTTSERAINDPTLFLYGRLVSSVQIENVQGDEGDDEVHRVQSITIESIV